MIKKIALTFLIITVFIPYIGAKLQSRHWRAIATDIARDGDPKDLKEFEAAKQAFLHIQDETQARQAAQAIEKRWGKHFGINALVGSKAEQGSLMSLIRYPLMTKEQAKKATERILNNSMIQQFLDEEKITISTGKN